MSEAIFQSIAELNQPEPVRQAAAAELLAGMGEAARPAIVPLVQACGSENEAVRTWCTAALEGVGPPAREQIDDLVLLARSANGDVAFWAVTLLGRARDQAAVAVPTLAERLVDRSSPQVQLRAAWALGRVGRSADSAVDALRLAAEGADAPLATQAQQSLRHIEAA